jgi:hypothetical protein
MAARKPGPLQIVQYSLVGTLFDNNILILRCTVSILRASKVHIQYISLSCLTVLERHFGHFPEQKVWQEHS